MEEESAEQLPFLGEMEGPGRAAGGQGRPLMTKAASSRLASRHHRRRSTGVRFSFAHGAGEGCVPLRRHDTSLSCSDQHGAQRAHRDENNRECHPLETTMAAPRKMSKTAAQLMADDLSQMRSRRSVVNVGQKMDQPMLSKFPDFGEEEEEKAEGRPEPWWKDLINQIPAIAVVSLLNLMLGIPFGVSYFPVGWKEASSGDETQESDSVNGPFPLPGKAALGIRMFLFSTAVAQAVFTFQSKFVSPVGLQMVENVPFCHALAYVVIAEQGYGMEALSTLFFLFGLSSIMVGITFFTLGYLELGRVVYFFPNHVLVGCIGGIGVFILLTSIEVSTNADFGLNFDSLQELLTNNLHLFAPVLFFEVTLRILVLLTQTKDRGPKFPLLSPIFFCMITPIFYVGLWLFGVQIDDSAEFFFPSVQSECDNDDCSRSQGSTIFLDEHLLDIWRVIDFRTISWTAVFNAFPVVIALAAFSLIHVPINIPAFAVSTGVDVDMNAELIAHGYSNGLCGFFGGLQNYMCYSNSVLFANSEGHGKTSSLAIAAITGIFFIIGPSIANYIPRCMAGTLLLHIGLDLFLEGVVDSFGRFDTLEYAGIWLITLVMTIYGMSAALIAGIIAALSTYAVQSITYQNPVKGTMKGSSLRSSCWDRSRKQEAILGSESFGREKIFVIQLQGHIFFGNLALMTETIICLLKEKQENNDDPWIVILDFTLVGGLDSSAAHAVSKLNAKIQKTFDTDAVLYSTGSVDGFPCEFALTDELSTMDECVVDSIRDTEYKTETTSLLNDPDGETNTPSERTGLNSRVFESLDEALIFAEDMIVARQDPLLLQVEGTSVSNYGKLSFRGVEDSLDELETVSRKLSNLCPEAPKEGIDRIVSLMTREEVMEGDTLWEQGNPSNSMKLLVSGELRSTIDDDPCMQEIVVRGNIVGELGLVSKRMNRLTSVVCSSEKAILYSLDKKAWALLTENEPKIARVIDSIVIDYLTHRVQHVSNRIFETRCLPV